MTENEAKITAEAETWWAQWVAERELAQRLKADNDRLRDENAKLRIIAEAVLVCDDPFASTCEKCPLLDKEASNKCRMDELFQELGIGIKE